MKNCDQKQYQQGEESPHVNEKEPLCDAIAKNNIKFEMNSSTYNIEK